MAHPALTPEQAAVVTAARTTRDALFITGPAGTGKSVVLRAVIAALRAEPGARGLYVTASTGIAALDHDGGQTLHRFGGLGMGDEPAGRVVKRLLSGAKPSDRRAAARWQRATTLVIEEVSMVSAETFDLLHEVACRVRVRPLTEPFGGIRLILVGDMSQLPPVPTPEQRATRQPGRFAFESAAWARVRPRVLALTEVHRQPDPAFCAMLAEVRRGHLAPATEAALRARVGARFPEGVPATYLFPLNRDVDALNAARLAALPGQVSTFVATDEGDARLLRDVRAPPELALKVGAQVMMLRNTDLPVVASAAAYSDSSDSEGAAATVHVVNGMMGHVVALEPARGVIQVRFPAASADPVEVTRAEWTFYDHGASAAPAPARPLAVPQQATAPIIDLTDDGPASSHRLNDSDSDSDERVVLARRTQYPLVLAYAMSAHKSQGQTLTCNVIADLGSCFEAGQAYVILSRIRRLEQLSLRSFRRDVIRASPKVSSFYDDAANR